MYPEIILVRLLEEALQKIERSIFGIKASVIIKNKQENEKVQWGWHKTGRAWC